MYNASMLAQRKRRIPWTAFVLAAIILAALFGVYIASPSISMFEPLSDSDNIPASAPIEIRFSQAMNHRSVERRFQVEPHVEGSFSWDGNTVIYQPEEPWPFDSEITVRLEGGARSERLLPIIGPTSWTFSTGGPRVAYLWPEDGPADLYIRPADGFGLQRLTQSENGVLDYTVMTDGYSVIYAELRQDGGSDLRQLNTLTGEDALLYACQEGERCQNLAISDQDILLFDRIQYDPGLSGQPVQVASSVWAFNLDAAQEPYRIGLDGHQSTSGDPSPAGWVAYYDVTLRAITIVESITEEEPAILNQIPNDLGFLGAWSPDGLLLLYPAITFLQEDDAVAGEALFFSHIYQTALPVGPSVDLSGSMAESVEDSSPAVSPDGQWIAFTRKYLGVETWTLGRQLWLMRADGSNPRQMTDDPALTCSSLVWREDSGAIVYVRVNEADYTQASEIWLLDVETGDVQQIVMGGFEPNWLP